MEVFAFENIVGKRESAGWQHFLFFSTMFSKALFLLVVKTPDCVLNGKTNAVVGILTVWFEDMYMVILCHEASFGIAIILQL